MLACIFCLIEWSDVFNTHFNLNYPYKTLFSLSSQSAVETQQGFLTNETFGNGKKPTGTIGSHPTIYASTNIVTKANMNN